MGTWKVPSWPAAGICISLAHGDASTPPAPRGAPCPARETASSPPFSLVHFYKFLQYPCPFFFFGLISDNFLTTVWSCSTILGPRFSPIVATPARSCPFVTIFVALILRLLAQFLAAFGQFVVNYTDVVAFGGNTSPRQKRSAKMTKGTPDFFCNIAIPRVVFSQKVSHLLTDSCHAVRAVHMAGNTRCTQCRSIPSFTSIDRQRSCRM